MKKTIKLVYFIDRSLGKEVAEPLRNAGAAVEIHDDHFRQDTLDEEWLRQVGERNWVVLTKDRRIGYRNSEKLAVAQSGVRLFVLSSGNLTGVEMGEIFVKALSSIEKFFQANEAPFMAKVYDSGKVQKWQNRKKIIRILSDTNENIDLV